MQLRTLGKTGLKICALAYGGSSLGPLFHDINENEGIRSFHVALEHGINFIDAAPFYGLAKAEAVLPKALDEISPERIMTNIPKIEEPLDETSLHEVQDILKPVHNLTWPSGRPENN